MANFRMFFRTYSPMFAILAAIIGIYAMAICIGCGIALPV